VSIPTRTNLPELPPKHELVVWTHISAEQRRLYVDFVNSREVRSILSGAVNSPLVAVTWLKKLCGHPLLAQAREHDADLADVLNDLDAGFIVEQSPKLRLLLDLVQHFLDDGRKALIFSQSTKMLNIIQAVMLVRLNANLLRIDGQTKEQDRYVRAGKMHGSSRWVVLWPELLLRVATSTNSALAV